MAYTKPQVTIDLDEYQALTAPKIQQNQYEAICKEFLIALIKNPRMDNTWLDYMKSKGILIITNNVRSSQIEHKDITIKLDPEKWPIDSKPSTQ